MGRDEVEEEAEFSVEIDGPNGFLTAFYEAASQGELSTVVSLLEAGHVQLNDVDEDGFSALMIAAAEGQQQIALELLARGANVLLSTHELGSTALHFAAKQGDPVVVEAICKQTRDHVDFVNANNETPLVWACVEGRVEAVRVLLQFGADVDIVSGYGATSLICAVMLGEDNDENEDEEGEEDEISQEERDEQEIERRLASDASRAEIIALLLKKNPQLLNRQDPEGSTAMHLAAACGYLQCVKKLLSFGADVTLRNGIGQTPLEEAEATGMASSGPCVDFLRNVWTKLEEEAAVRMLKMLEMEETKASPSHNKKKKKKKSQKKTLKVANKAVAEVQGEEDTDDAGRSDKFTDPSSVISPPQQEQQEQDGDQDIDEKMPIAEKTATHQQADEKRVVDEAVSDAASGEDDDDEDEDEDDEPNSVWVTAHRSRRAKRRFDKKVPDHSTAKDTKIDEPSKPVSPPKPLRQQVPKPKGQDTSVEFSAKSVAQPKQLTIVNTKLKQQPRHKQAPNSCAPPTSSVTGWTKPTRSPRPSASTSPAMQRSTATPTTVTASRGVSTTSLSKNAPPFVPHRHGFKSSRLYQRHLVTSSSTGSVPSSTSPSFACVGALASTSRFLPATRPPPGTLTSSWLSKLRLHTAGVREALSSLACGVCGELVSDNLECRRVACGQLYCAQCVPAHCVKCAIAIDRAALGHNAFAQKQAACLGLSINSHFQDDDYSNENEEELTTRLHDTLQVTKLMELRVGHLVPGMDLSSLSMGQLEILEQVHHQALRDIVDARIEHARAQERAKLQEQKRRELDIYSFMQQQQQQQQQKQPQDQNK